jgi:hypothetical protein
MGENLNFVWAEFSTLSLVVLVDFMVVQIQGNLTEGEGSVQLTSIVITSLVHMPLIIQTLVTFYRPLYTRERYSSCIALSLDKSVYI